MTNQVDNQSLTPGRTHTPNVVQGGVVDETIPPRVFGLLQYFETISLRWKAFDLLYKMRYILWVVALLGVCDVTNNGRHLEFYQELEIRLGPREMAIFLCLT